MNLPSLRSRIRNGTLPAGAGRDGHLHAAPIIGWQRHSRNLYRNYVSIEVAQHLHESLRALELAERDGKAKEELPRARDEFRGWMDIENHNFTEVGEPEIAHDIETRAEKLFKQIDSEPSSSRHDTEFGQLHGRIDDLIKINRDAMFRADSKSVRLGRHLTYQFIAGLAVLLLAGVAMAWALGWAIARPLTELTERLRGIGQRRSQVRLGQQSLAELQAVTREFNQMAERLEQFEKLNVERLMYEKSKTEAIIESLEDGVVLIDSDGVVAHINEIAALIMGVEPKDALGSPFDDLSSNHTHYLRVRDALRNLSKAGDENRIEVQLHVRGRDHTYLLAHSAAPQRRWNTGTILILQDVTYLRDQDRARANLVATISHELRTPLTSLALSAELLQRDADGFGPRQHELLDAILDECARIKLLSDNLIKLARGEMAAISVNREQLNLSRIVEDVVHRFSLQARQRQVQLEEHLQPLPEISGDSIKLSWVVSNLIGNALRYTPAGGRIEVAARPINGQVRLEVADSGPGIPAKFETISSSASPSIPRTDWRKGRQDWDSIAKDIVPLTADAFSLKGGRLRAAGSSLNCSCPTLH